MKILVIVLMLSNIAVSTILLWPEKPVEAPEVMTLLLWGPPNEDIGTVQWIHGKASDEQAKAWKVWQPDSFVLQHRFVIEGKPIE